MGFALQLFNYTLQSFNHSSTREENMIDVELIQALVAEAIPQVEESLTEYRTGDLVTVLDNLLKIAELCEEDRHQAADVTA